MTLTAAHDSWRGGSDGGMEAVATVRSAPCVAVAAAAAVDERFAPGQDYFVWVFLCSRGRGRDGGPYEYLWTANSLRTLLTEAGAPVDEHVVRRFITSRALQSSLSFCSTAADAAALYEQVAADPASETRANVLGDTGVCIDGDIIVPHRTTALLKWAFDGAVPCVLKLPAARGAAALECRLYDELGAEARASGINLVPVRLLHIKGSHRVGTDTTLLSAGVIMPAFPLTLAGAPPPVVLAQGVRLLAQLLACVDFLGAHGWVHGDVKPSNVFLSATDGQPWLGDFGSSVRRGDAHAEFAGGTLRFQLAGVAVDAPAARFDRAGIVVTFAAALGLLEAGSRDGEPWPVATVRAAVARVDSGSTSGAALAAALVALLESVVGE